MESTFNGRRLKGNMHQNPSSSKAKFRPSVVQIKRPLFRAFLRLPIRAIHLQQTGLQIMEFRRMPTLKTKKRQAAFRHGVGLGKPNSWRCEIVSGCANHIKPHPTFMNMLYQPFTCNSKIECLGRFEPTTPSGTQQSQKRES